MTPTSNRDSRWNSIQRSIECYRSVVENKDLSLLKELFESSEYKGARAEYKGVIGLMHPFKGMDIDCEQQDDKGFIYDELLPQFATWPLLTPAPHDVQCGSQRMTENPDETTIRHKSELHVKAVPAVAVEGPTEQDFLSQVFELYAWTLEKTGGRYLKAILRGFLDGALYATIDHSTPAIRRYRDKAVKLLLGEVGKRSSDAIQMIETEYAHRPLECVRQILHFSKPLIETEDERAGICALIEMAAGIARRHQLDEMQKTVRHYESLLNLDEPAEIEKLFDPAESGGRPPFVFLDVAEQVTLYLRATTEWMLSGPGYPDIGSLGVSEYTISQLNGKVAPDDRNEWVDYLRELISVGLDLAAQVVSHYDRCLLSTVGSVILGSITSVWIDRIIEYESSGVYDGDKRLSDAYCHYFAVVHRTIEKKLEQGLDSAACKDSLSSDFEWSLRALETIRHGFVSCDLGDSAKLLSQMVDSFVKQNLSEFLSKRGTSPFLSSFLAERIDKGNRQSEELRQQSTAEEVYGQLREQQDRLVRDDIRTLSEEVSILGVLLQRKEQESEETQQALDKRFIDEVTAKRTTSFLKHMGAAFWRSHIPEEHWKSLSEKASESLTWAGILCQNDDYRFPVAICLLAAEDELRTVFDGFRFSMKDPKYGKGPGIRGLDKTFTKLRTFVNKGDLCLGSTALILDRLDDKRMLVGSPNVFSAFKSFLVAKGDDCFKAMSRIGRLLMSDIDGVRFYDLRNKAVHPDDHTVNFDKRLWLEFLERFIKIVTELIAVHRSAA